MDTQHITPRHGSLDDVFMTDWTEETVLLSVFDQSTGRMVQTEMDRDGLIELQRATSGAIEAIEATGR